MTSKGLVQEAGIFAVLAGATAMVAVMLGSTAGEDTQQIFDLMKNIALFMSALIVPAGIYFFWKAWN